MVEGGSYRKEVRNKDKKEKQVAVHIFSTSNFLTRQPAVVVVVVAVVVVVVVVATSKNFIEAFERF